MQITENDLVKSFFEEENEYNTRKCKISKAFKIKNNQLMKLTSNGYWSNSSWEDFNIFLKKNYKAHKKEVAKTISDLDWNIIEENETLKTMIEKTTKTEKEIVDKMKTDKEKIK